VEWIITQRDRFENRWLRFYYSILTDNKEQRHNSSDWKCSTDVSIVTQDNRLRAKNTGSYQYRGKRNTWLFHGSIIRRNVRLARDLMRKKFTDQKNVVRYSLLMSRKNALDLARLFMLPLFLSLFLFLSLPLSLSLSVSVSLFLFRCSECPM